MELGLSSLKCTINSVQKNSSKKSNCSGKPIAMVNEKHRPGEKQKQDRMAEGAAELAKMFKW